MGTPACTGTSQARTSRAVLVDELALCMIFGSLDKDRCRRQPVPARYPGSWLDVGDGSKGFRVGGFDAGDAGLDARLLHQIRRQG